MQKNLFQPFISYDRC